MRMSSLIGFIYMKNQKEERHLFNDYQLLKDVFVFVWQYPVEVETATLEHAVPMDVPALVPLDSAAATVSHVRSRRFDVQYSTSTSSLKIMKCS